MRTVDLIQRKRDGEELAPEEIEFLVEGYTNGDIPDYQMSAFLMAVFFSGMSDREVSRLTECMLRSGDTVDLSAIPGVKVDKHSTGGVGDKTSFIVAPLAAAAGVVVPMMSGRALGHTGGTLDKLESIPGFRTDLTAEEFSNSSPQLGSGLHRADRRLAPADRKLYALRDVTGTVESIPLISSSIMSKKLAEGVDCAGAGRQSGQWRLHEEAGGRAPPGADHGGNRPPHGQESPGADHRYEPAARLRHRQRARGHGGFADPAERRPGGSHQALAWNWPRA